MKYKCKETFTVNNYDEDGALIENEQHVVEAGDMYILDGSGSTIIGGEVHLDKIDGTSWLEITKEHLAEYFTEVYDREELLQKAKPVLFNTEMVQAIQTGKKTVTRRVVKPQPNESMEKAGFLADEEKNGEYTGGFLFISHTKPGDYHIAKAPFMPGDMLYVRETWCDDRQFTHEDTPGQYFYKSDFPINGWSDEKEFKWKPSIHMPKEAARIFLQVTEVAVERLQDINGRQILAEGVDNRTGNPTMGDRWEALQRMTFSALWDTTIKKQEVTKYGWIANPWVWVVTFRKVEVE